MEEAQILQNLDSQNWLDLFSAQSWAQMLEKSIPYIESVGAIAIKLFFLLVFGHYLSRVISKKIKQTIEAKDKVLANFLSQIIFAGINIAIIIAALGTLGVQTTSIIAVLSTAGVAIALGLKDSLSSVASGIILIVLRPFQNGDLVELGGLVGVVQNVNLFNTTIRLADGKLAVIPNANIAKSNVVNSTDMKMWRVDLKFGVAYDSDILKVKKIAQKVIDSASFVVQDKPKFVGLSDMSESSLDFVMRFWIQSSYGLVEARCAIYESLVLNLELNGITIPFNQLDVNVREISNNESKSLVGADLNELEDVVFIDPKTQEEFKITKHNATNFIDKFMGKSATKSSEKDNKFGVLAGLQNLVDVSELEKEVKRDKK